MSQRNCSRLWDYHADFKENVGPLLIATPVYRLSGINGIKEYSSPTAKQPIDNEIYCHYLAEIHNITAYDWIYYLDLSDHFV